VTIAGIILAAGAGRRVGSPKALLQLEGETFFDRMVAALQPSCDPVIAVLGHHEEAVRNGVERADAVRFVRNPEPERGMLSSLQCGLRALPEETAAAIFCPVDFPLLRPATVKALAEAFRARPDAPVVVPTCEGRRGHPVLAGRRAIRELLALPPDASPRDAIRRFRPATIYVETGDAGILHDVDTPADYQGLEDRTR